MLIVRLAALGGALAVAGGMLVPSTHAAIAAPSATQVATRSVSVDVDGDGAADAVTIEQSAPQTFVVNVVTAASESAVTTVTSSIIDDWGVEPWYGAAKLDHVKGKELLLLTSGGDGVTFRVLTWRNHALVFERAPSSLAKGTLGWYLVDVEAARFGYRFSTVDGKRHVREFELFPHGSHWKGTIVTSVWKAGAWKKVGTKTVNLTAKQAERYRRLAGVTITHRP
ncbi:MAG: hypothetical protein QM779_14045 [Propionicimonas sp.]|uniref:hypothetical protein n=1 Tax=Propionicimonas sp. TaxID=1955623 RepID=UPI003D0FFC31